MSDATYYRDQLRAALAVTAPIAALHAAVVDAAFTAGIRSIRARDPVADAAMNGQPPKLSDLACRALFADTQHGPRTLITISCNPALAAKLEALSPDAQVAAIRRMCAAITEADTPAAPASDTPLPDADPGTAHNQAVSKRLLELVLEHRDDPERMREECREVIRAAYAPLKPRDLKVVR
jgi:hypothetical protein